MGNSTKSTQGPTERDDGSARCEPARKIPHERADLPSEIELFAAGPSPRLFGEGSYVDGGPLAEGNYALPDANPRGGYGSFGDAGGFGSTELLGEKETETAGASAGGQLSPSTQASALDEGKDIRGCAEPPVDLDPVDRQFLKHD